MLHNYRIYVRHIRNSLESVAEIYFSKQFVKYIMFGSLSTVVQLAMRYVLSFYMSFSLSVFIAYFVSMGTALFLYRAFVFIARTGSISRQVVLFALGYLTFLPVTWGLSVGAEGPLLSVFAPDFGKLAAHLIGVGVPVMLHFAFNKLVTFRGSPAAPEIAS
jgi:putative flippase GtrA